MVCSLAAAALAAAVPAYAQQPYGAGVRTQTRPVSTFNTPYPTIPTPGPVRPYVEQQQQESTVAQPRADGSVVPASYRAPSAPRPKSAPGAAGKVMYFHKAAGALAPDDMPDFGAVAMASNTDMPAVPRGVPDVPAIAPGALPTTPAPATVIEKPIAESPFVPFNPTPVPPLPTEPTAALPIPPRVVPVPLAETPAPMVKDLPPEVTELPPRRVIFQMYDDAILQRKILEKIGEQLGKPPESLLQFPTLKPTVPLGTLYVAKTAYLPPGKVEFEPGFVIHHHLHFEEMNSERYGWDLGFVQPFVSTLAFYKNVILWPHSLASSLVVGTMETNAGKCLPGSPTPYYLYPPGLTITGGVAEGAVITGLSFIIP